MTDTTLESGRAAPGGIGFFEKWLSVWVALCIVVGIALGTVLPASSASSPRSNTLPSTWSSQS